MVHRVFTTITAVALFSTLIAFAPPSAQALSSIETPGDYIFTGGLTGSFHSDGMKLTTWNFTYNPSTPDPLDPLTTWKDTEVDNLLSLNPQTLIDNDASQFYSFDSNFYYIQIIWDPLVFTNPLIPIPPTFPVFNTPSTTINSEPAYFSFSIAQASVPEPSSALLLLAGLVLLAGYRWRQQHSTGMQVG